MNQLFIDTGTLNRKGNGKQPIFFFFYYKKGLFVQEKNDRCLFILNSALYTCAIHCRKSLKPFNGQSFNSASPSLPCDTLKYR